MYIISIIELSDESIQVTWG